MKQYEDIEYRWFGKGFLTNYVESIKYTRLHLSKKKLVFTLSQPTARVCKQRAPQFFTALQQKPEPE